MNEFSVKAIKKPPPLLLTTYAPDVLFHFQEVVLLSSSLRSLFQTGSLTECFIDREIDSPFMKL